MKIFICYRSIDKIQGEKTIADLLTDSENSVAVLKQTEHIDNWKDLVEDKIKESDFVAFLIGSDTFKVIKLFGNMQKLKVLTNKLSESSLTMHPKNLFFFAKVSRFLTIQYKH